MSKENYTFDDLDDILAEFSSKKETPAKPVVKEAPAVPAKKSVEKPITSEDKPIISEPKPARENRSEDTRLRGWKIFVDIQGRQLMPFYSAFFQ